MHDRMLTDDSFKGNVPIYRRLRQLPKVAVVAVCSLFAIMVLATVIAFQSLHAVLTCAPVQITDAASNDTWYYNSSYDDSPLRTCIPQNMHASWIPALLGAFAVTALLVLALFMALYLLRLVADYVNYQRNPEQSRGNHHLPGHVRLAFQGLTLAAGLFLFAATLLFAGIYYFAIS